MTKTLTTHEIEKAASNFIEEYKLSYGNSEYGVNDHELEMIVESPSNWTNQLIVSLDNIETLEELKKEIETEYLRMVEDIDVNNYFEEMYTNVMDQFSPREFLQMLEEDKEHYDSVADKINGVSNNKHIMNIEELIYTYQEMDYEPMEILLKIEDSLKGVMFELDLDTNLFEIKEI